MALPINSPDSLPLNHADKPDIQTESGSGISATVAGSEMPHCGKRLFVGISLQRRHCNFFFAAVLLYCCTAVRLYGCKVSGPSPPRFFSDVKL